MAETVFALIIGFLMLLGATGVFIPAFPGISMAWGASLVFALVRGWDHGGIVFFVIITVLAIIAGASNYLLPKRRAAKAGAGGNSIALGLVGALVGLFVIPAVGLPVGGALGIWLGEKATGKTDEQAWASTKEVVVGIGLALVLQFALALWMFLTWLVWLIVLIFAN